MSKQAKIKSRGWPTLIKRILLGSVVAAALWCVWIDYQIRTDFKSLQWALPARVYARPVELYVGAEQNLNQLTTYLQRLGYARSARVSSPGEYLVEGSRIMMRTRGFDFWDGEEPSMYVEVGFSGNSVSSLSGGQMNRELAIVRMEPVEIGQINPETGEDRVPIPLEEIPQALIDAVVAVEDQRFYNHFGVDPIGIARAMVANLRAGAIVQGGSTLTQQLVKNLYLNRSQTLRRKIEEALMAISLDFHFSKDEILAAYMNEVFLGQQGNRAIHGFALGSEFYFGRPLSELGLDELALLAGLPRGPSFYNPQRNPERATTRRNVVLVRMLETGFITEAQHDEARRAPLRVVSAPSTQQRSTRGYPAFMELVYRDLSRDYNANALRTEGLRIFTTLDVAMQNEMESVLARSVASIERPAAEGSSPLEAAVVITDASTGEVRALAGGRRSGFAGFNRALNAVRPIGSLVKPAVYLAALESRQFTLASVLADSPIELPVQGGEPWTPRNYDNRMYGDVYLYDALERSMNLATVDLGMQVGLNKVNEMLTRLGHARSVPEYPSMLLGAIDMAPIEVAQLYQTLAANGFRSPLRAVEAVTSGDGSPLERYGIATAQVADPASIFLLEYAMQGVFERGTARTSAGRLVRNLPLAGKTGTTNDQRDSWFAGYGDDLVGVVWLGHDDNRDTGLTGATGALRVWTDIMIELGIQPRRNPPPQNIQWQRVALQAVRTPSSRNCSNVQSLPFRTDGLPDIAVSCEDNGSVLERFFDRFRDGR
ncbi:MAG: penicillin-binding protein 1B [Gammaproteobacteria bacterium]|nr:penicillin-binding protein 1B [Gammaproteobacteria bacterium]